MLLCKVEQKLRLVNSDTFNGCTCYATVSLWQTNFAFRVLFMSTCVFRVVIYMC